MSFIRFYVFNIFWEIFEFFYGWFEYYDFGYVIIVIRGFYFFFLNVCLKKNVLLLIVEVKILKGVYLINIIFVFGIII